MPRFAPLALAALLCSAVALPACATLRNELDRADLRYEESNYEAADVWLVSLETRTPDMSPNMRVRYYYLRGMTAFRREQNDDAKYFLALGRELIKDGAILQARRETTLRETLAKLIPEESAGQGS